MRKKTTWLVCFTLLLASAAFASFSSWGNPPLRDPRGLRKEISGLRPGLDAGPKHRPSVQAQVESNAPRALTITLDASGLHVGPDAPGHGPAVGLRWTDTLYPWARLGW